MKVGSFRGVDFPNGMPKVRMNQGFGDTLSLQRSSDRHMSILNKPVTSENVAGSFANALTNALSNVERLDVRSNQLTKQAIYDPDSVDTHTVIIAAEKAKFALNFTKTVSDGVIRAFKELSSPR